LNMKIMTLQKHDKIYSCRSYLILGDWNRIEDINTVIDPGTDDFIIDEIESISTGFGKIPVNQIILTHNHFDHGASVMHFKEKYNAKVFAYIDGPGVDELLTDGQFIKAGDDILEVLHTPGHSSDSICLYAPSEKALFSGDTQIRVMMPGDRYEADYIQGIMKIACRDIQKIYSGHDDPLKSGCQELILQTLHNIQSNGKIISKDRRISKKESKGHGGSGKHFTGNI
jgi:glyoxylase-like metal-dependent hydrolase (beta-lactamase superfamily II)